MRSTCTFAFTFCLFVSVTYQGISGSAEENKSGESMEVRAGNESSSAEGPPDSHEAMNNRELKPKLTIGDRKKRSYQFLMGLVKRNNASYEITNDEHNAPKHKDEAKGSELLLELMVKIAGNPDQWSKVHDLLQKIDKDLMKSKEIIENMKTHAAHEEENVTTEDIHKLNSNHERNPKNSTEWETTKYPWQLSTRPSYQKNFAYHRVTGNPLVHTGFSKKKNAKAYIAVSVIAPKPLRNDDEDDAMLENELKELKPWTHQQNLKNMAQIRSRWVIQSNEKKSPYSP